LRFQIHHRQDAGALSVTGERSDVCRSRAQQFCGFAASTRGHNRSRLNIYRRIDKLCLGGSKRGATKDFFFTAAAGGGGGRAQVSQSPAGKQRTRLRQHLRPAQRVLATVVQLRRCYLLGPNSISAFSAARTAQQRRGGKSATRQPANLPTRYRTPRQGYKGTGPATQPRYCA
jgi:hypothetical protein